MADPREGLEALPLRPYFLLTARIILAVHCHFLNNKTIIQLNPDFSQLGPRPRRLSLCDILPDFVRQLLNTRSSSGRRGGGGGGDRRGQEVWDRITMLSLIATRSIHVQVSGFSTVWQQAIISREMGTRATRAAIA